MIKKSGIVRISLFSVLFSLLFPSSYAASSPADILQLPIGVYSFLSKNLLGLTSGSQNSVMFARFLIVILVYIILYVVASGIFPQSQGMRIFVPLILAIISTVLIPPDVLLGIFKTYTIVAVFFIWIIPPLGAFWFAHKVKQNMGDGPMTWFLLSIIYFALIMIIPSVEGYISKDFQFLSWFQLIWFILVFAFCHAVIKLLRTMIYGHEAIPLGAGSQKWGQPAFSKWWKRNPNSEINDLEQEEGDVERTASTVAADEIMEIKEIKQIEQAINKIFERVDSIILNGELYVMNPGLAQREFTVLETQLNNVVEFLNKIISEENKLKKLQNWEQMESKKILDALESMVKKSRNKGQITNLTRDTWSWMSKVNALIRNIQSIDTDLERRLTQFHVGLDNTSSQVRAIIAQPPNIGLSQLQGIFSNNNRDTLFREAGYLIRELTELEKYEQEIMVIEEGVKRAEEHFRTKITP